MPAKNPFVANNVAMFGAIPLRMMLVAEMIDPAMIITRQPTLLTRFAAIGPAKNKTPHLSEPIMEVAERSVPNVSMKSLRNRPVLEIFPPTEIIISYLNDSPIDF